MGKIVKWGLLKKYGVWALWFILFQCVLINISAAMHAWKLTHFYTDPNLRLINPPSTNLFIKTWKLFSGIEVPKSLPPKFPSFRVDTVLLKTHKGLTINCWYATSDSQARGTVAFFHGVTGNKNYYNREAAAIRYMGYNILMVDIRGHGSSNGNTTTIGYKESEDVKLAYDFLLKQGEKNIFLLGTSMGAVGVAKAISDYNIKPVGIMLEMPFASLQTHAEARSRIFGFPEEFFGFLVAGWIGIEQGFIGYKFKVTEYVKKIDCPVLLSWGTNDKFVLKEETEAIFKNISGVKKKLIVYEDAGHQSFLSFDPIKWKMETEIFLSGSSAAQR